MTPPVTQYDALAPARVHARGRTYAARAGARPAWAVVKRASDILFSSLLVLVLAPLLLAVAVAIRLDSSGPVLFRQRRVGRDMEPFTVLKFRTMQEGAPTDAHKDYIACLANGHNSEVGLKKLTEDPRVTRVGAVLRKLSIDELPQLFNVIRGSMSLIGPRPALPYELEHYRPRHYERFLVRPGLSGLWQVSGRNQLGFNEMLDLDADYAETCGPLVDAKILLRTPVAMVRDGA